jgi:hypothetical protein
MLTFVSHGVQQLGLWRLFMAREIRDDVFSESRMTWHGLAIRIARTERLATIARLEWMFREQDVQQDAKEMPDHSG